MYKAIVTQTESMKHDKYIGMTENHFKTIYNLHNSSFRLLHRKSTTTLSEHLWKLKDAGVSYKTEWTVLDKAKPCSSAAKKKNLCLAETYFILLDKCSLLNKRSEISGTCLQHRKHLLQNSNAALKKRNWPDVYSWREYETDRYGKPGNG